MRDFIFFAWDGDDGKLVVWRIVARSAAQAIRAGMHKMRTALRHSPGDPRWELLSPDARGNLPGVTVHGMGVCRKEEPVWADVLLGEGPEPPGAKSETMR